MSSLAEAFDAALVRLRVAEEACDAAVAEKKEAKQSLREIIGELASLVHDQDGHELLSDFYWLDELTGKMLADALRRVHKVPFIPKPIEVSVPCRDCGVGCVVRCISWTSRGGLSTRCDACQSRHDLEWIEFSEASRHANGFLTDEEIAEARAMPYRDYLMTNHWQVVRVNAIGRAKGRCQVCHSAKPLDVHHRTYERLGCEWPGDVIALCRSCHGIFHKNGKLAKSAAKSESPP